MKIDEAMGSSDLKGNYLPKERSILKFQFISRFEVC